MSLLRPPIQRGMKELDRSAFVWTLSVVALRVPNRSIGQIKSDLSHDVLRLAHGRLQNVIKDEASSDHKLVLLKPEIICEQNGKLNSDVASTKLQNLVSTNQWDILKHNVTLGYEHWSADDILKAVLPDPTQAPTAFEQIGHIAHMNLREEYLDYKLIIGQVILDKSPTVKTVVNKLDTIDNTFRNFQMEVLAGEPQFLTQVRENDCTFKFDYSKVYWNSRLHGEHERLIHKFAEGSSICDVMAGVGPFAVPAGRRGALVWANDLNPASFAALEDNIRLNKVQDRVRAFNMDGREFIRQAFAEFYTKTTSMINEGKQLTIPSLPMSKYMAKKGTAKKEEKPSIRILSRSFDHVVMNLPAIAIEFLDAFRGLFRQVTGNKSHDPETISLPLIHAHCFTKSDEPQKDILQRACRALGYPEDKYEELEAEVYYVRKVAPKKDMYCLSLRLPESVAYAELPAERDMMNDGSPANGKRKTGDSSNSDKDVATKLNKIDH